MFQVDLTFYRKNVLRQSWQERAAGLTVKVENSSQAKVAEGAGVNAEPDRAGMADVAQALVWAAVVLVVRPAGKNLLPARRQLSVVDDSADHLSEFGMFRVQLASVVVRFWLKRNDNMQTFRQFLNNVLIRKCGFTAKKNPS